jgi:hypothetical protein
LFSLENQVFVFVFNYVKMTRKSSLARLSAQVLGSSSTGSSMDLLFEKRVLFFMTWTAIGGVIFWLASVATDYWVIVVALK